MMAALVIAGPLAGWLAVFIAFLGGPRLGRPGRRGPHEGVAEPGAEPPAVVALLAGRPDRDGFNATLLDLAARGWFGLTGPAEPAMCILPAEAPIEHLTPYERRAVAHVAQRTGPQREIPAGALADGYEGGEAQFLKAFRLEVTADARQRGLTRPTLSTRRKALLCLLALVPPAAALLTARATRHDTSLIALCAFYYVILSSTAAGTGSERLTAAGQAALRNWGTHTAEMTGTRHSAYAAALGHCPVELMPFIPKGEKAAWSGYADTWRLLPIADHTERVWPGISIGAFAAVCLLAIPGIPLLGVLGYLLAGGHGAELGVLTGVAADVTIAAKAAGRWSHLARFAEFDGLVLRQWQTGSENNDDGIEYFVAVDDGASAQAWAFPVESRVFGRLPPGTLVRVQANPRLNKLLDIKPLRRMPVAPALADAADLRPPRE